MRGLNSPLCARHPTRRHAGLAALPLVLTGCSGDTGAWLFGTVALVLVAASCAALGWLWGRRQQQQQVQALAQQLRLAQALAEGLWWRTDSAHRLQDAAWGPPGLTPWSVLEAGEGRDALEKALTRQQALPAMALSRADDTTTWRLSALPCFDAQGGFAGHVGHATGLLPAGQGSGPVAAALAALVDAAPAPMWVLVRSPAEPRWQVLRANESARRELGQRTTLDDTEMAALLPKALVPAWQAGQDQARADGWAFCRQDAEGQQVALLWPLAGPDSADTQALGYTVSHDLRAPVRVVEGFTRIIKEDYGAQLDRVANDHLDRVLGAAARMNQMIDAMLALARLSSLPLAHETVDLSQLARLVMDDLQRSDPGREAEIQIEPGLQGRGDPTQLRQVLENLLGNAWKYSSKRSQTRIVFAREKVDGRTAFVVRDNGAGFDMRSAERLFGPFQRLHSANDFPGTGVGLASVRRIVQRHGGDVWADGEPGRGAAFHFTLGA